MFSNTSFPFARQVVIAAIVGTAGGAAAGMWSVRQRAAVAPAVQTPSATPSLGQHDAQTAAAPAPSVPVVEKSVATGGTATEASAPAPTPPPAGVEDTDVLQRAKALAQRGDVRALVALRESVARRAAEAGETESVATKQQLDELDRCLEEARLLRLKLDAEQFKHAETARTRPR